MILTLSLSLSIYIYIYMLSLSLSLSLSISLGVISAADKAVWTNQCATLTNDLDKCVSAAAWPSGGGGNCKVRREEKIREE